MKKPTSRTRSSSARSRKAYTTVDEYLARVPEPARSTLNNVRETIRSVVPSGTEEVISYGIPAFKYKKVLVWYAGFKDHCSFFPTNSVIEEFKDELKGYRLSKGTIQFPVDGPLPAILVKKMVRARLAEIEKKRV